jgi:uncharacterized protein (TIGR01777 family)
VSRNVVVQRRTPMGAPPAALWAWHAAPGAFERLAPPWERAEVVAPTHDGLVEGSEVTLRVRKGPLALSWVARHREVVPGAGFVDEQVRGPFARWHHAHQFLPHAVGGELVDTITLAAPFGWFGRTAHPYLRGTVDRMLRYRHTITRHDLEQQMQTPLAPMRIAITGATGMVGRALTPMLTAEGHTVVPVSRRPIAGGIQWDPTGPLDAAKWEGLDAVIHLAGENIADGRWTDDRKRLLRESRVGPTRRLAEALASLARPPRILLSASATGIYGDTGERVATEATPPASDFLGELGAAWEAAAAPARDAGIRVVHPRFGIILSTDGGALAKMLPTARLGAGGPLGGGSQWMSWIALDDVLGGLRHLLADATLQGPVNLVAPGAVRNTEFAATLGAVLQRPAILPVPAFALRLLFGEMADATLLASSRVAPTALEGAGYHFRFPALEGALRHLLGR